MRSSLALIALLLPLAASAERETTRDALSRLEESLQIRLEDGGFNVNDLLPAIVVSLHPTYEETRTWYPTAALSTLVRVFGGAGLRNCEACMGPRTHVEEGRLEQLTTGLTAREIIQFDNTGRGTAPPAKTAIWLDENPDGVSLRIIDLSNSRVVMAENFDPSLSEATRTRRAFTTARSLERRARGDSIVHTFIDLTLYPGQHFSLDWLEQWGDTNENLSGLAFSIYDPVFGVGASYFRVVPQAFNVSIGAKLILSVPTAIVTIINNGQSPGSFLDPLVTGVLMARWPIFNTNYALIASISTRGSVGVGISLINMTLLPVLP